MELVYLFIGIALGAVGVYFAMRSQVQAAKERNTSTEQQMRGQLEAQQQQMREQQETYRQQMKVLQESHQQQIQEQR